MKDLKTSASSKSLISLYDQETQSFRTVSSQDLLSDKSQFGELSIASRNSLFNIKPTYGISTLRDETGVYFGAGIQEVSGEIKVSLANQTGSNAYIESLERGAYKAGMSAQVGFGVRIPTPPTGQQYVNWGYYDTGNGFGFGMDQTGIYCFKRFGGVDQKFRRGDWNVNNLSGETNIYRFHENQGNIYEINFVWYGYGTTDYKINVTNTENNRKEGITIHRDTTTGSVSIVDPNQPLRIEAFNQESVGTFDTYIGGRQFSVVGGDYLEKQRPVSEVLSAYTLSAAQNVWEPIMVLRKAPNYGNSNRPNSVKLFFESADFYSDQTAEFMVTIGGSVTGTSWQTPSLWDVKETSAQVQLASNNALGIAVTGNPILRSVVPSTNQTKFVASRREEIVLGKTTEVIVFGKRQTANTTTVTAILRWEEDV